VFTAHEFIARVTRRHIPEKCFQKESIKALFQPFCMTGRRAEPVMSFDYGFTEYL
jgi:hypothetical protein